MKRLAVVVTALLVLAVATSALAATLSGKYKTVIKHDPALGGVLNGTWIIKLKNGAFHATENGHPVTHGTYSISGNVITVKDAPGPGSCPAKGKYAFTKKGKHVTFTLVHDSKSPNCLGRQLVLNGRTFTKI